MSDLNLDRALNYADLRKLGEGSRVTIWRRVKRNDFPPPDYYVGRGPRWLESSLRLWRENLIKKTSEVQA